MNTAQKLPDRQDEQQHLQLVSFPVSPAIEADERYFTPDAAITPSSFQDATNMIEAVGHLEAQLEIYRVQLTEAQQFFEMKSETLLKRIEQIKSSLHGFLDIKGLRNIQTPRGTAYLRKIRVKQWPDDDALVSWALEHSPKSVKVRYTPDRKLLSEHIKATGEIPDTYSETEEERLYIRH